MPEVSFVVAGVPVPWNRAGQTKDGRFFVRKPQKDYMNLVRDIAAVEMRRLGLRPAPRKAVVEMEIVWYLPHPKAARPGERGTVVPYGGTPDWDNCGKIVGDALGGYRDRPGIVFEDDAQVSDGTVRKRRVPRGDERLEVTVSWV